MKDEIMRLCDAYAELHSDVQFLRDQGTRREEMYDLPIAQEQCIEARAALLAAVENLVALQYRQAPCHKFCEANAFQIELRQLRAELEQAKADAQRMREALIYVHNNGATWGGQTKIRKALEAKPTK